MRRISSWVVRTALAALAALIVVGLIYEHRGETADAGLYPAPGIRVAVGSKRLHLNCQGEGSPTVVLEALSGGFSTEWAWIQPELAQASRVCSYDRAGRAWSDDAPAGDLWQTAETLHALLREAGEPPPYVLAGHSIGGLYVRAFAERYGEDAPGLALVDAAHPLQFERYPELGDADKTIQRLLWTFPWMARVGLFRYYFQSGGEIDFGRLPPRAHAEMAAVWSTPRYHESVLEESRRAEEIFRQARELGPLGDLPVVVISADSPSESWKQLQKELAALSTRSTHVTVRGASHSSLAFDPEHAQQVAAAIAGLIDAVRDGAQTAPAE